MTVFFQNARSVLRVSHGTVPGPAGGGPNGAPARRDWPTNSMLPVCGRCGSRGGSCAPLGVAALEAPSVSQYGEKGGSPASKFLTARLASKCHPYLRARAHAPAATSVHRNPNRSVVQRDVELAPHALERGRLTTDRPNLLPAQPVVDAARD